MKVCLEMEVRGTGTAEVCNAPHEARISGIIGGGCPHADLFARTEKPRAATDSLSLETHEHGEKTCCEKKQGKRGGVNKRCFRWPAPYGSLKTSLFACRRPSALQGFVSRISRATHSYGRTAISPRTTRSKPIPRLSSEMQARQFCRSQPRSRATRLLFLAQPSHPSSCSR